MSVITSTPVVAAVTHTAARVVDLTKVYGADDTAVRALDSVSLRFAAGQFTAIMGPSGSGKSTLLHTMAGLDAPTSGEIFLGDTEITALSDAKLTHLRRDKLGFVFQAFNLLPTLTALENITLPLDIAAASRTRSGSTPSSTRSGSGSGCRTVRASSPAASSSASPRLGHWRAARRSSSPTSPLERSTPAPPRGCSPSCAALCTTWARRSSWSPTTPQRRATPTGSSSSPTAASSPR
jgi:ABC-type sugar transport system ATPase subunit